MYLLAPASVEADNGSGMVGSLFRLLLFDGSVAYGSTVSKRLIEFDDEVVFEVCGYASAVAGSVSDDSSLFRHHFDVRASVERVDYDVRMLAFGESEAEDSCTDRKSTRLNSSHANISYAVFCLKKKTQN